MDCSDGTRALPGCPETILESTFAHTKLLLRTIVKQQDFETLFPPNETSGTWSVSEHTISDVQRCLKEAQASYECRISAPGDPFNAIMPTSAASTDLLSPLAKSRAKARMWLTGISEKLLHYSKVFDVMVQHHPEYVSLAWGTFKLVFIAITNHAETASKLSKSISQIADLLPQHSLHLILYPTPEMQVSVARLYAYILKFFLSSLRWYKDHRIVHAIKSVLQPWDLRFRHEYEAIAAESQQIVRLADAALKAEVRDTRLQVEEGVKEWELFRQEMGELKADNQRLMSLFDTKFGHMETSIMEMYQEVRLDLSSNRTMLNRVHLTQMLSLPLWNALPTSGESLKFCRSIRNRNRQPVRLPLPAVQKLEAWSMRKDNALLLIESKTPMTTKTFMVDMIDLILESRLPTIWALRYADYWDQQLTPADIIRILVLQAMQVSADSLLNREFPVTVERLRSAASLSDWIDILDRLLCGVEHVFIMLDADLINHAVDHERSQSLEMLDLLRSLSNKVKIVIAASTIDPWYIQELEHADSCVKLQAGGNVRVRGRMYLQRSRQPRIQIKRRL